MGKLIVGGRFQTNENKVGDADLVWCVGTLGADVKITFPAAKGHSVAPDHVKVRAEQEMDGLASAAELRAIKTPHGTTTDNGHFHRLSVNTIWQLATGPKIKDTMVSI